MAVITDPDLLNQGTEITLNTGARTFSLNVAGNLSNDGVTLQALYSFLKEEWKTDTTLIPHPFPATSITPEQFELIDGWKPNNDTTRKLIRTGGWKEIDTNSILQEEHAGIITLGTFEDSTNDLAYYQPGNDPTDTGAALDFDFAGPVNEAVRIFKNITLADASPGFAITGNNTITRNDGGNWITEGYVVGGQIVISNAENAGNNGSHEISTLTSTVLTVVGTPLTNNAADTTLTAGYSYRNKLKLFLRVRDADPEGKTYAQANLTDIGVTSVQNQVYRFPLSNATDLKITETDANIAANSPYTQISIKYFSQSFSRDVDTTGVPRNFGICLDVGTYSGVDGLFLSASTALTSSFSSFPSGTFDGGTLTIHETFATGSYTITTATGSFCSISSGFPSAQSDVSFTLQRATPVAATAEEIYEKAQYLLRQATDVDSTNDTVTGRTADELLTFVGDTLATGRSIPSNPNGGGSGVVIEGFDSNDTNRLIFTDNGAVERTFPFVAAGTIGFNTNLVNDTSGEFWMFFRYTRRTNVTDGAITAAAGNTATITSAGNLPTLANNDYISISGFTNSVNNGIWQVTDTTPTTSAIDITKVNGDTVVNESATAITVDEHPFESDGAIIVDDNSGVDISGAISGATRVFDFDYDGNIQGGRTAATDAAIVIVAIGLETAQYVTAVGTITRATGISFNIVSGLERNYSNP